MSMRSEKAFQEFCAAFWMLVRTEGKDAHDGRPKTAQRLLAIPQKQMLPLLSMLGAHDLAAQLSSCIGVRMKHRSSIAKLEVINSKNGTLLKSEFERLAHENTMPLGGDPKVPDAEVFLKFLCTSVIGRQIYRSMAMILLSAQEEQGLRVHLYWPDGKPNFKDSTKRMVRVETEAEPTDAFDHIEHGVVGEIRNRESDE